MSQLLATGICILAMTSLMMAYMGSAALIRQKTAVSQLARKYILRMETVGYLTEEDRITLQLELEACGATQIVLEGSTLQRVSYGEPVALQIRGCLKERYEFEERRVSTAKN